MLVYFTGLGAGLLRLFGCWWGAPQVVGKGFTSKLLEVDQAVRVNGHGRNPYDVQVLTALQEERRDGRTIIHVEPARQGQHREPTVLVEKLRQHFGHGIVFQVRCLHKTLGPFALHGVM
jgi:hypothetical protein